jgi:hypothetical protein
VIDPKMLARHETADPDARLADLLVDLVVPAMAALLTIGLFLLALR